MRAAWIAGLVAATFARAGVAVAAPPDEGAHKRAAESFRQAQAAFERREFAAAAAAFEQAAEFEPHPAPLLDASDAWERAGEAVHAAEACDRALALAEAGSAFRRDAEACERRLEPRVATIDVAGPRTFAVSIDGGPQTTVPGRRRVAPGRHALAIVDLGSSKTSTLEVAVAAGEVRAIDVGAATPGATVPAPVPLPPTHAPAVAAAPPPPAAPETPRAAGVPARVWIAFGVAGAGAIASGVLAAVLYGDKTRYDSNPTEAGKDAFHRDVVPTDVAIGVTAAAAVTGVVLWLAAPRESPAATVGLAPSPGGAVAVGTLRF